MFIGATPTFGCISGFDEVDFSLVGVGAEAAASDWVVFSFDVAGTDAAFDAVVFSFDGTEPEAESLDSGLSHSMIPTPTLKAAIAITT